MKILAVVTDDGNDKMVTTMVQWTHVGQNGDINSGNGEMMMVVTKRWRQ